jgi:5-carboxymethyl-2-hydroxymuconate isomerase
MPHCIVEASKSIVEYVKIDEVTKTVFQAAQDSELFNPTDIRARAQLFDGHIAGSNSAHFIHVTIKLLAGRTAEQKTHLANLVLENISALGLKDIALSVEVADLFLESYVRKLV